MATLPGMTEQAPVTRFAPSPTGLIHLGNAYAALFAYAEARRDGGRFLLRIEDIDPGRCRPEFETALHADLAWLGLAWERPVLRQSDNMAAYAAALARLQGEGLLYPCFCTRREIAAEIALSPAAPHGAEGPHYPGTCRDLSDAERQTRMEAGEAFALRLDAGRAARRMPADGAFVDRRFGRITVEPLLHGDVVLARKDVATSYHLAVTVDDAAQGITLVTRGEDLLPATHVQRVLQVLLDLPAPEYHHHPLLRDDDGERMAKRRGTPSLASLREQGLSPADVRAELGFAELI